MGAVQGDVARTRLGRGDTGRLGGDQLVGRKTQKARQPLAELKPADALRTTEMIQAAGITFRGSQQSLRGGFQTQRRPPFIAK